MTTSTNTRAKALDPHLLNRACAENAVVFDVGEPCEAIIEALILPSGQKFEAKAGDAFLVRSDKSWKHVQFIEDGTFTGPMIYTRTNARDATDLARNAPFFKKEWQNATRDILGIVAFTAFFILMVSTVLILIKFGLEAAIPVRAWYAFFGSGVICGACLLLLHFISVKSVFNRKAETGLAEAFYSIFNGRKVAVSLPLDLLAFEGAKAVILSKSEPTPVPLHWLHDVYGKSRNGVSHPIADIENPDEIKFLSYGERVVMQKDTAIAVQTKSGWHHLQFLRKGEIEGPMLFAHQPKKSTENIVTSSEWYSYELPVLVSMMPVVTSFVVASAEKEMNFLVIIGGVLLSLIAFFSLAPKGRFRRLAKPDLIEGIFKIHDGAEKRHRYPSELTHLLDEEHLL